VVLSILPLALIGGEVMRGFALAILFGIVIGTSSSIFIASPILLFLGRSGCGPGSPGLRPPARWRPDSVIRRQSLLPQTGSKAAPV
jgi:SecD/SecF fusion protein